jgi:membrane protease YdiL (CAAX protease family)
MPSAIDKYRHPLLFYGLATAIPWAFWFSAAYLSHVEPASHGLTVAASMLGVCGLVAPVGVAAWLIGSSPALRHDALGRLFRFKSVPPRYLVVTCFLMLASILLAQAVSLLFGYGSDQFALSGKTSFSAGIFPGWFLLFLAPCLEELAWHSYGTDCLRNRMSLFSTSLVFGLFWVLWHIPLGFIKGYYHANVAESGMLYTLNFALSLIPFAVLMNWLYYKTRRNILVAVVFHISAGSFNEAFKTHPASKVIQTGLLLVLTAVLLIKEREFFFSRAYASESP